MGETEVEMGCLMAIKKDNRILVKIGAIPKFFRYVRILICLDLQGVPERIYLSVLKVIDYSKLKKKNSIPKYFQIIWAKLIVGPLEKNSGIKQSFCHHDTVLKMTDSQINITPMMA